MRDSAAGGPFKADQQPQHSLHAIQLLCGSSTWAACDRYRSSDLSESSVQECHACDVNPAIKYFRTCCELFHCAEQMVTSHAEERDCHLKFFSCEYATG